MQRLCIFVPDAYIETLDLFVADNQFPNRSEAIRVAIRNLIQQQIELRKILEKEKTRFFKLKEEDFEEEIVD